jgi:fused signal recognition particle receptor
MSEEKQGVGWWGSTLGRLKSALSKTKEAVVDSVLDRGPGTGLANDETITESTLAHATPRDESSVSHPSEHEYNPPIQEHGSEQAPSEISEPREQSAAIQTIERRIVPITDNYLEELEEKLIRADLGVRTVDGLISDLRKQSKSKSWTSADLESFLKKEFQQMLVAKFSSQLKIGSGLNIVLVVGVNGTGKTTSIGKLCHRLRLQGKKVLMGAADTFRAAAETQLEIWAERAGVNIVRLPDGSDPGAVVFQAIKKAREENFDVLVIDTAGRLHNKTNLMSELKKVRSVIDKNAPDTNLESLLVLDASTGQNGLQQAKVFTEAVGLTGVILTKLDGTAKGGVVFAIATELKLPVKLIGLGERIDDLRDFEPELFVEALF